jgi:hypothetical protein
LSATKVRRRTLRSPRRSWPTSRGSEQGPERGTSGP